ncbi:MAG: DciA family protein, partial [Rickettsiales bacterium]
MSDSKASENTTLRRGGRLARPLYKIAEQVTKPAFKKHGLAEARLVTEWHQIAGPVLAERTLPTRMTFPRGQKTDGTLYLTVAPGWATEVQHL